MEPRPEATEPESELGPAEPKLQPKLVELKLEAELELELGLGMEPEVASAEPESEIEESEVMGPEPEQME